MSVNVTEVVEAARHLTPAKQRKVLARLWPEQAIRNGGTMWMSVRFSDASTRPRLCAGAGAIRQRTQ